MFCKKKKYDLIFGIGEACSCSQTLRSNDLQIASYPLDWLFGTDFVGRCRILASEFDHFIEKQDLSYSFSTRSISCDAYYNKHNDLTFNHDFKAGKPLDETYDEVRAKYDRRIARLLKQINAAKRILIVYMQTPLTVHIEVDDQTIEQGFSVITNHFKGKNIDLLYLKNSASEKRSYQLGNHIRIVIDDYKSHSEKVEDYAINSKPLKRIFESYKLSMPFSYVAKRSTLRFFINNFIPVRSVRRRLRKKYHLD